MRALERRQHLGARARARRGEQRDLVAALGQLRGQERDHLLDPAVAGGRHGYPRGCQHRDPHSLSPMSSPLGAIPNLAETIVIKDGNVFMVTLRDGRLPAGVEHPLGLWFRDCRFLSAHEVRICGELPRLLTATDAEGTVRGARTDEPGPGAGGRRARCPPRACRLRIERRADAGGALRQTIGVRSYHRGPLRLPVEVRLGRRLPPHARAARHRAEARAAVAGRRAGRLLARGPRRGPPRPRRCTRAPEPRVEADGSARVRPRPRAARRDRPDARLRGVRARGR